MNTKRFITEYANYKMSEIDKSGAAHDEKIARMRRVDRVYFAVTHGEITIDEAMREIANA